MKALVEYIAGSIVSKPDEVQVTEDWEGERVYVRLTVASDDKGKVIGRTAGWPSQFARCFVWLPSSKTYTPFSRSNS